MSWTIEVKVLSTAGVLKAYFSNNTAGGAAILDLEYTRSRIGGCGELSLTATRERASGHAVALGDLIEVWTSSTDETSGRRYRGIIVTRDVDYIDGTMKIGATGFFSQFQWALVSKFLETTAVDDVISDIFDAIKAQTYCETTASISVASPAAIGDIEIDFQPAAEVIKKLAELQGSINYGVDEDGTFYFSDKATTKRGHFQLGRNIKDLKSTERLDDICNDVIIKTRGLVSDGTLVLHEADSTSISAYKKRTKVISAPEFHDYADAVTYGEAYVARRKDPAVVYKFTPILSTEKHFPYTGTVALVDENGAAIGTVDIEEAKHIFDGDGFHQDLTVGDVEAAWDLSNVFSDIDRKVMTLETGGISAGKIEHSGYDEFRQYVQSNATAAGLYNIWTTRFEEGATGKNVWEEPELSGFLGFLRSRTLRERGVRHTVPATDEPAVLETIAIPTGRVIDTLRVYHMQDIYGRVTFNSDASLEDWWNYDCSDDSLGGYIIDSDGGTDGKGALVGNPDLTLANRGVLEIKPMNWANEYLNGNVSRAWYQQTGSSEYCRFRADNFAADNDGDAPLVVRFDTATTGDGKRAEISLVRVSSTTMKVLLETYDARNSLVDSDETAAFDNKDLLILFSIAYSFGNCSVVIHDTNNNLIDTLNADRYDGTSTSGSHYVYINEMWNSNSADTGHIELKWWEIRRYITVTSPGCDLMVSRDGGANWETHQFDATTTPQYTDYDLSGQGSGTEIKLKATFYWPCQIYGLGFAWSGD